jgi:hypothetical protein
VLEEQARKEPKERREPSPKDCSASYRRDFTEQSLALQSVLLGSFENKSIEKVAQWFNKLGNERRFVLTSVYNRLCDFGLWRYVESVKKVTAGEKAVWGIFQVPGSVGSVSFTGKGTALYDAILNGFRICQDRPYASLMHPGQHSTRQISISDNMHVSVGPGDNFDVHIDKYSEVSGRQGSHCIYDPAGVAAHLGGELIPEFVRKAVPIVPGFEIFPEPSPRPPVPEGAVGLEKDVSPVVSGITLRFPAATDIERQRLSSPQEVHEFPEVERAIREQVAPDALVPAQAQRQLRRLEKAREFAGPDEERRHIKALAQTREIIASSYAVVPLEVANWLAVSMIEATRRGENSVSIQLGPNYKRVSVKTTILSELKRIALIVRPRLPARFKLTARSILKLPPGVGQKLGENKYILNREFFGKEAFLRALQDAIGNEQTAIYGSSIAQYARLPHPMEHIRRLTVYFDDEKHEINLIRSKKVHPLSVIPRSVITRISF